MSDPIVWRPLAVMVLPIVLLALWHGAAWMVQRTTARLIFAWYDVWVGAYWDRRNRRLYILPIPCVGIVIEFEEDA